MKADRGGPRHQVERLAGYLRQDPENWSLRAQLFDVAFDAGEREVARELVEEAARRRPEDPEWQHRGAVLALSEGRHVEAESLLRALMEAGHDVPAIRHNLAFAQFGQGRWELAKDTVEGLLDGAGEVAGPALVLWLRSCHRLGRVDEALDRFLTLSSTVPVTPEAWGTASLLAVDGGRMDEARAWSDRALVERPGQLEALAARATVLLGELDAGGAHRWFEEALRQNAGDGRSWSGLAFARMLAGDLEGAEAAFEKAVAAMPDHLGTWLGMGWCQVLARKPKAARLNFERALELDRNVAEVHGALAVALARLGEAALARVEIEVALRLDRANMAARYAEAVLSGAADDPAVFQQMARKLLGQLPRGAPVRTAAEVVLGGEGRRG